MKRFIYLLCLGGLVLSGCTQTKTATEISTSVVSKVDSSLPEKELVEGNSEDSSKAGVILSDSLYKSITEYCSQFTYIKATQQMTSFSLDDKDRKSMEQIVADVSMEVDLLNKINMISMSTDFTDSYNPVYYFVDDNKNGVYLSKIDDEVYSQSDVNFIDMDYSKVVNAYDFVTYMLVGVFPEVDSEGYCEDGIYSFTTERDAVDTDLIGVNYDKLGKTTITSEFNVKGTVIVPKSITMETTFFVGQNKYGVSTVCKYLEFSNKELQLPEYINDSEE